MAKQQYRIWLTVTTGPHKTPVETFEFVGRKRAFRDAAQILVSFWTRIRRYERGELQSLNPNGWTRVEKRAPMYGSRDEDGM